MCSIAIPSELLLGHSPPVYGSLLYSSLMVTTPPIANRSVPPQIRPCLASASLHLNGLLKSNDDVANNSNNNKRNKKKVVFADDRGWPLTQVRVMSEPSNMPPFWTSAYVASLARGELFRNLDGSLSIAQQHSLPINKATNTVNGGDNSPTKTEICPWEASFAQPASDYLAFRNKLDKSSVSLENVIVRDSENCLIGTIKVKNLAYDKEVTIRATCDNWKTYQDVNCSYVEQPGLSASPVVRNLYDTFRFRLPLPEGDSGSNQLEFCVRYNTEGAEFWDNNAGANYVVKKKRDAPTLEEQVAELLSACCGPSETHNGFTQTRLRIDKDLARPAGEATRVHLRTWSEFASWQHLDNEGPYW
ncbi:protein phosphatase 1 regulatory subunit 3B-A [Nasonia vitripennis]|uniref:CBM21 domain-containing protein n=1 Tax=Nasonia vitripennis TaxID=7425 RepID=A0A7M7TE56_NASVI|nr:protein phosphatase 1 regulatory subunit 3B-A [Nasonia vitripennis]XP_032456917.1 protein phosphatase 1 regulatory subunit 3B-A [Nasonia vitripennis]XP_032456918.1 protein phosphatase 1 regulatory subunit 3B-A [Nasonia vitripennis]XP_032456919.1 protein phosphatase 1 regulatory subunit 3B-A [Nasonia vitripennis]XP_032456920.1 protein phosphatase 1 regulatory subunit 3B-A [Nasonia vitripennis]XP_032456921.1 protein phosphatase 1 regulatory subunit 3B-A [Nasonia vitripennis]XP_032456922.1 pr